MGAAGDGELRGCQVSRTIWKFVVAGAPGCIESVVMPMGAKLLHAHEQDGGIRVWAEVDPDAPRVRRLIGVAGTGWSDTDLLTEGRPYIGTVHIGPFVWHLFDGGESE